jgi:hypothetical protein
VASAIIWFKSLWLSFVRNAERKEVCEESALFARISTKYKYLAYNFRYSRITVSKRVLNIFSRRDACLEVETRHFETLLQNEECFPYCGKVGSESSATAAGLCGKSTVSVAGTSLTINCTTCTSSSSGSSSSSSSCSTRSRNGNNNNNNNNSLFIYFF